MSAPQGPVAVAMAARRELRNRMEQWEALVRPEVQAVNGLLLRAQHAQHTEADVQAYLEAADRPVLERLHDQLPDLRAAQRELWTVLDALQPDERHAYESATVHEDQQQRRLVDAEEERKHGRKPGRQAP